MKLSADRLIKDKNGHIVLWQSPNVLLAGWIVLKLAGLLLQAGQLKTGLEHLATAVLFAWAFGEATKGVDYFRKALGVLVLVTIIIGFFRT